MKKIHFFVSLFIVLFVFSTTAFSAVTYCSSSAFGYSTATGGSGAPVLVSSVDGLKKALNKANNKVIIITANLTFSSMVTVQDGSNVTLLGMPGVTLTNEQQTASTSGILFFKRFSNLIIRNLTFVGPGAYDCDGNDLLCFENVTNAWVDHCDFQDGVDGNFDNKHNTDNITVSWCRFRYLKAPKPGGSGGSDDHRYTNLLGASASDKPSDGTYNLTWAYCWWDNGCKERMVRCRNAELHFLNCYWNSSVANYYVGPENAKCYFEGCTFDGKANTKDKIFKSYGGTNACKFVDCDGNLPSNSGTVSKPSYSYTASGREEAKDAIISSCGAGATLTVTKAGEVSSTCDGGAALPTIYTVTWDASTNGGACITASSVYESGDEIGTLPVATKSGYTFDGWFTSASGGTAISASTTVLADITYFAQFTEESGGGGSGDCEILAQGTQNSGHTAIDATVGTITTTGGQSSDGYIKLSGSSSQCFVITAKSGYTITAGDKLTVTVYNKNSSAADIGFQINSVSHTINLPKQTEGQVVYTLQTTDISAGTVTIKRNDSGDRYGAILLERCSGSTPPPVTYTLSYDENGGTGTMEDQEQTGASVTVAANGFTAPTGYKFHEWNDNRNGNGTDYDAGEGITLTADFTLYAIWEPLSYTITFDKASGFGGADNVSATFDEPMPSIAIPSRTGHTFLGYFTEKDGAGTQYYDGNGNSTNSWTTASGATLHAAWESGGVTPSLDCALHYWFFKEADATANGITNDETVFASMVSSGSSLNGSITVDGISSSVTGRTGDPGTGIFGYFTIPDGKTGVFYGLAVSSGDGDRQINLESSSYTSELSVPGGSKSYQRLESEVLPAGTYAITRDGTSNVRMGVVIVKICEAPPTAKKVYLKPGTNWMKQGGGSVDPRFAVYYWKSTNPSDIGWLDMTLEDDCGPAYSVEIPNEYDKCIFCRMAGDKPVNDWSNKWNQTDNLDVPTGNAIFFTVPDGAWDNSGSWSETPLQCCVDGTRLRFAGETIMLTAKCVGARKFQWYKDGVEIPEATSATYTKAAAIGDGGNYTCKAWLVVGQEATSSPYGVRVPFIEIQTPPAPTEPHNGDYVAMPLIRASEEAETASCSLYRGVAWDYAYSVTDGLGYHGNTGTMTSANCTNWTMDSPNWCRMQTTKEGTYTFEVKFSNSAFTNYTVSLVYPPMKQTAGRPIYIENTASMGWNPDAIYYRIGKGQYGNGDDRNWTAAQRMTLVPGTARYFKTTTPDWGNNFWAWHICNNRGDINQLESVIWGGDEYSIYRTKVVPSNDANEITQSSNFSGDEIPDGGWTIYLADEGENGKIGDYNNNCEFHDYTHTPGMLTHKVTITAPEHGKLTVNYVDVENNPQAFGSGDRDLAHTCIITVTAVPECGYAEPTEIFINGSAYGNRDPFTLTEDIIVSASFDVATYSITYNLDGGTINSGEVTEYTFGVGATLPTDVTKSGKEFEGWYDNAACSGTPITSITTTDCDNKTYWANWITCPAVNSGVTLYKFEVKSSMTSGNVCAAANTDYPMTTSNSLSELIGGTLTARVSSTNRLLYSSGAFTYKNGDGGVLRVDLDCPIASGDIIRFINSATGSTYNAYVRHTSSTTSTDQIVLAEKNPTITSIAIPDAFIGETTLYIVRGANNGALISYFEIVRSCAVLLDANGGKVGGEDTKTVRGALGDEVALPHAFKDGEKFKGWYDAPSDGTAVSNPYTITGTTTLYAQYEDCPDEGTLYKFEVATGLTNGSVTANDVDFEFTTANYLTALIGGTLMTGGSKASKVNIKGNNALNITDNAAYLKIDLDCEIQDGDVFKSTISSNTVYVTNATTRTKTVELPKGTLVQTPIPETLIGQKTLYLWKGDGDGNSLSYFEITRPYSVTYKPNGATGSDVVRKGGVIEENMFVREDYNFIAWNTVPDGSGDTYYPGDEVSGPITLYAQWEEIIRSIVNLDATGAYNHYTKSVVATYNLPMPEIATLPQRVGYVFEGYYDEPNGAGTQYYTGLGTSMQNWDKTTSPETLYASWTLPCDLDPTLKNIMPVVTMWDGKKIDEGIVKIICDFDTTGIKYSLLDFVPSEPLTGDLHFEYFDEQIHLIGTSDYNNSTVKTITVTFTIANNCEPQHTYSITSTIRIYPKDQKAKIAFIVTGTKGGAFSAYSADDAAACNDLVTYLRTYFDVTFVNGYATKDNAALATYYAEYDLLIVTDYLNTKEGYTNAIGTLIDKKPILSFEAYVANQSNWHISSNPRDPSPKVQDMKVLCAGHAIFKDAKYNPSDVTETEVVRADTTVQVLDALSTEEEAKGLQGFTINEAPDFIFLATVKDEANNRDLIVCCERQVVFPARLLIYGINFYEMGNLSNAGKIIMRQMIDYLLMTDETKVADCSLVFDNGAGNVDFDPATYTGTGTKGDHKWSTAANWAPGYNIIPTPYIGARIIAECHVNVDDAHAGNVRINKGKDEHGNPVEGKLIIKPYGGLTVAAVVQQVNDTRYASPVNIKAEDLLIESNETGNGAFVYGNKESDVRATVQYYSRAEGAKTSTPVWQYMGTPFQAGQTAIGMYREAWMCRWSNSSDGALGGLWQWVDNEDLILPFEGYCITQEEKKTYTFAGKLNAPVTTTLFLDNRDDDGYAFAANSWTAPIKIQEMKDEDFVNAERTIYIYHTGTYAEWESNGTPVSAKDGDVATLPGQYAVVPIHSSPYILGADSVIPAMQGFFVKTDPSKEASLKLVYNRVVYDAKYFKTSTQPMRAPGRAAAAESEPDVMRLLVAGESFGGDQVHILSRGDFSEQFEDGWDGRKIDGDETAPKLAVVKEEGEMAVAAVGELEGRELSFRAGKDSQYTFHFDYEGERIYLYDKITHAATEIQTGNTYTFEAGNQTPINRFLITKNPPKVPTDIPAVDQEMTAQPQKYIDHGQLFILYHGRLYDMTGKRVAPQTGKEETR